MSAIALVRANALLPFIAFLDRIGAPTERMLHDVGLPVSAMAHGERLLPLRACLSFLATSARSQKVPELGIIVGQHTRFEQLGAFAQLGRRSATLQQLLVDLAESVMLHNSADLLWLRREGDRAVLCHRFTLAMPEGWLQGEMFALSMMIAAIRAALGPAWRPLEVRLPGAAAALRRPCEELLQTRVVCAGEASAVVFDRLLLCASNRGYIGRDGRDADLARLRRTAPCADLAGSLRQTISVLIGDGYPEIGHTASVVGISVRTLQRRLAEAGESYSHLVEVVRCETGRDLLSAGDTRLIDIAGELGYADAANFTRAFRRWTGVTPSAYRRRRS